MSVQKKKTDCVTQKKKRQGFAFKKTNKKKTH